MKLLLDTITRRKMTGTSSDMKLSLDNIMRRQWQEHHLTWSCCWTPLRIDKWQEHHLTWNCCWTSLHVDNERNIIWHEIIVGHHYTKTMTGTSSDMKLLLDTITRRQWQEHHLTLSWCWTPLHVDKWQEHHLTWNCCWTTLHVDNDRNIIWHEAVVGHHYT